MKSSETHSAAFSLHQAAGTWQEVLDIGDDRLGQIGHGAIAATRGTVIEEIADSRGWVLFKEIFTGILGFLGMQR